MLVPYVWCEPAPFFQPFPLLHERIHTHVHPHTSANKLRRRVTPSPFCRVFGFNKCMNQPFLHVYVTHQYTSCVLELNAIGAHCSRIYRSSDSSSCMVEFWTFLFTIFCAYASKAEAQFANSPNHSFGKLWSHRVRYYCAHIDFKWSDQLLRLIISVWTVPSGKKRIVTSWKLFQSSMITGDTISGSCLQLEKASRVNEESNPVPL